MLWLPEPELLPEGLLLMLPEPVVLPDEPGPQSLMAVRDPPASPLPAPLLLLLLLSLLSDELLLEVPVPLSVVELALGLFVAELLPGPQSLRPEREPPVPELVPPDIEPDVPPLVAPLVALGLELVPPVLLLVCASAAVPRVRARIDAPVRKRRFIRFLHLVDVAGALRLQTTTLVNPEAEACVPI